MSALAEALVAAQRRALSALEKQAVAGKVDGDAARQVMEAIGCTDSVDQDRLLACLDVIRDYGAALPAEPTNGATPKTDEPATPAQITLIDRLTREKQLPVPNVPLTKASAHEVIDSLKAGTYDPGKWKVPF